MKPLNILITGATGFVGTAMVDHLYAQGHHVVALVRDRNKKNRLFGRHVDMSIAFGDIRDRDSLRSVLSNYEINQVYHLASNAIVRVCDADPCSAYQTNIVGTINLMEACRELKVRPSKILVMTSDKAYGASPVPYLEDTPPTVGDTYITSKICQDLIARSYALTYDLPVVVTRSSNIYGPGDLNISRIIPRSILNLLEGKPPVIYSDVANFIREFIYIDDVVTALDTAMNKGTSCEATT